MQRNHDIITIITRQIENLICNISSFHGMNWIVHNIWTRITKGIALGKEQQYALYATIMRSNPLLIFGLYDDIDHYRHPNGYHHHRRHHHQPFRTQSSTKHHHQLLLLLLLVVVVLLR